MGIAADDVERIFEPFAQVISEEYAQEGTGLGITISRQFVRLMGGELTVQSQAGKGSVFKFDIRIEPADIAHLEQAQTPCRVLGLAPGQRTADGEPYRILVAEDQEFNRLLLVKLLRSVGFEVREAVNGEEAVEQCQSWRPHLIWMDMRMPVMDGYEATRRIKSNIQHLTSNTCPERSRRIQPIIIALTASAFEENRQQILVSGCDDFVRKPFKEWEIFEAISKHLGARYVHAYEGNEVPSALAQAEADPRDALAPTVLATLPSELLTELEQVIILGNPDQIAGVLDEIRGYDSALAHALGKLVDGFEYEKVLALIQGGKEQ